MDSNSFEFPPSAEVSASTHDAERTHKPRGSALIAWILIVAMVTVMIFPHALHLKEEVVDPSIIISEIQARYVVGVASVSPQGEQIVHSQIQASFNKGSLRQRLMGAILVGELLGPEQASTSLDELETQIKDGSLKASDDDQKALVVLQHIQRALIAKTPLIEVLNNEESSDGLSILSKKFGWVGQLALLPPGSPDRAGRDALIDHARRTFFVMLSVFLLAITAAICGALLQIVWWVFATTGRLKSGIQPLRGDGAIYAETFAVWMALFVGMNIAVISLPLPKWGLIWVLIPQIGSMGALAWPVFRGLHWGDIRKDIGLTFGENAWSIPFVGVGTYLSALPVLGAAMIVTLLMMAVASQFAGDTGESIGSPVHPIVEPILRGSWTVRLQLLFVAVFAAVPEEIMFRGVLYRHLREAGTKFGYVIGVAFAALMSSFVFAVIHPQGLFGIPILMGLAVVFALAREWRGTIFPAMIAHALVNAGTSTVLLLIAD
jgi:membrane protease YdiL (CAAX protease family)